MTRADRIAAALERWEACRIQGTIEDAFEIGNEMARLLRESQPEPVTVVEESPTLTEADWTNAAQPEPAPVVEGDEPEYRAKVSVPEIIAMHEELIALRAALATAEEAKAKAVRSVAKRACEATAEWAMEDPSVLSPEWIESGKAGQQMNAIIDGCVAAEEEAIRARAGRNDD